MGILFEDKFNFNKLITNEYAFQNPNDPKSIKSNNWEMTSGSLFLNNNSGWTGKPDKLQPNFDSSTGNNSRVFRMRSKLMNFKDVDISLKLWNQDLTAGGDMWDGAHIWFRYMADNHLYYASVNRRDNKVLFKKKLPGGPSNDGTYYQIGKVASYVVPYGSWQNIKVRVRNTAQGVNLEMYINGKFLVSATDAGVGGPPILTAGRVGVRGDNAELRVQDFAVSSL